MGLVNVERWRDLEGLPSTVGVNDLGVGDDVDGEGLDFAAARGGDNGGIGALGDDDDAGAGGVLLGESCEGLGDLGDLVGLI